MFSIKADKREEVGKGINTLREQGFLPAILYGEGIKNTPLKVDLKEFEKIYKQAGMSSLITVELDSKKFEVLIHQTALDPVSDKFLHIDFYHPSTTKKVEAEIPLVFEGIAPAVKELGGVLVREIQMIGVKGLAKYLPREIKVDVSVLKTYEDRIYVKDLTITDEVEVMKEKNEIVALVTPVAEEKIEEEEKPAEEGEETAEGEEEEGKEGEEKEEGAEKPQVPSPNTEKSSKSQ